MKKIKQILLLASVVGFMASCTISHTAVVTNNAVGSKTGVINETPLFNADFDLSYERAMKNGGISTVGIAEFKYKSIIIVPFYNFTVTGE